MDLNDLFPITSNNRALVAAAGQFDFSCRLRRQGCRYLIQRSYLIKLGSDGRSYLMEVDSGVR